MDGNHNLTGAGHHAAALKLADSSLREITVRVAGTDPDALGAQASTASCWTVKRNRIATRN